MAKDGKQILKLTAILLVLCGIITLIIAIMAYSNAGKTSNTIKTVQSLSSASRGEDAYTAQNSATMAPINDWVGKAKTYSMIMMAVSILHIIFGIVGIIMAGKTENAMLFIGIGVLLLLGAAAVVIYPLIVNRKDYEAAQILMDLVMSMIPKQDGADYTFKLISLSPFKHVISYSSVMLGGMYLMGGLSCKGLLANDKPPIKNSSLAMTGMTGPSDDFFAQFNKPPVPPQAPKAPAPQPKQAAAVTPPPQGQPRPQGAPMQGQPRPQGAPPQGQPRPQGAPPQGQPRPQGAPMQGQPRPQGAPPQGQPRPQGAPMQGQPRPQGAPMQGQPRPQGAPMQGQPRPQGAPMQGQPRPQGAPMQGQPRPQGAPMQGQPRPQVRPAPNVRPAPGVKPKPPVDDDGPMSSGSMDEVALPSAEDLERLLGGMSGQK